MLHLTREHYESNDILLVIAVELTVEIFDAVGAIFFLQIGSDMCKISIFRDWGPGLL